MGGALYGFFWTDHCAKGHPIPPAPDAPLVRPQGDDRCPETDARNSIGRGVMARSGDDGRTFSNAVAMPPGFVYTIAVNPVAEGAPGDQSILIFGVPRYRASVPYMAEGSAGKFFQSPALAVPGGAGRGWQTAMDQLSGLGRKLCAQRSGGEWHPPKAHTDAVSR